MARLSAAELEFKLQLVARPRERVNSDFSRPCHPPVATQTALAKYPK